MYETYLRQLFRLRTEYWQTESPSLRNLKMTRMVLFANACGVDIIEFLIEEAPDKSTIKAESEPKTTVKAATKAKAPLLLLSFPLLQLLLVRFLLLMCFCRVLLRPKTRLSPRRRRWQKVPFGSILGCVRPCLGFASIPSVNGITGVGSSRTSSSG